MDNLNLTHTSATDQQGWKNEEYHGKQIHVCAKPCAVQDETLAGHGQQWGFIVDITALGAGTMSDPIARAQSDPELFYSTQAIAEEMGFIKGRELIDGI